MFGKLGSRFTLALTLAVCPLAAGPAVGQLKAEPPIGSRLPGPLDRVAVDESRDVLDAFGQCNVKENPSLAREFILSGAAYIAVKKYTDLVKPECLGEALGERSFGSVELHMTPVVMGYLFADALVKMDLQRLDPNALRSAAHLPEIVVDPSTFKASSQSQADLAKREQAIATAQNDVALLKYGECVLRSDPIGARSVLEAKVNSKEEGSALNALMPAFRSCLNQGQQFKASRLILRGILAVNYYRLAHAPRQAQQAPSR